MVSLSVDRQSIQCWETHRHNRPHAPFQLLAHSYSYIHVLIH